VTSTEKMNRGGPARGPLGQNTPSATSGYNTRLSPLARVERRKTPLILHTRNKRRFYLIQRCSDGERGQEKICVSHNCPSVGLIDYGFYQRMKYNDITEEYLWNTRLMPMLGYIPPQERGLVREALSLAFDAHEGQRRKSGEPFITHPVEVTRILAELRMDSDSLIAGLLHDTVEDCGETVGLEEIGFYFGQSVQRIVEGETKFSKLPTHHPERSKGVAGEQSNCLTKSDTKAQDLQFLFLAMTEEVRIIVVKLADRLHNMRTMASMPQSKQRRIAQETLEVFSPLARLLGLYTIKEELEELSFYYAMPQQYAITRRAVDRVWESQRIAVEAASHDLRQRIEDDPYLTDLLRKVDIEISRKSLYSIWRKLHDNGRSIREISEIAQIRVILDPMKSASCDAAGAAASERQLCYHAMGLIHSFWAPIPGSMKDYIATPKPNNYQSLHTTVIPTGLVIPNDSSNVGKATKGKYSQALFPIEIQIKTGEMERLAQFGIAIDSWQCADEISRSKNDSVEEKLNNSEAISTSNNGGRLLTREKEDQIVFNGRLSMSPQKLDSYSMTRRINWLNSIRQWQEEFLGTLSAKEFVACVTDDLLGQGVFVFTPSGQVMRLPKGASVVDFAYHIHTDIGNTMVAARVNGKIVPAEHRLANAEVVEVITYKGPANANIVRRHRQWLDAAQTKSARHKILKFLKDNSGLMGPSDDVTVDSLLNGNNLGDLTNSQSYWLSIQCVDRSGLLADISNVISRYNHNILSYSGSKEKTTNIFSMNYELEGPVHLLPILLERLSQINCVQSWSAGCYLQKNEMKTL